jgi:hypothetical protein
MLCFSLECTDQLLIMAHNITIAFYAGVKHLCSDQQMLGINLQSHVITLWIFKQYGRERIYAACIPRMLDYFTLKRNITVIILSTNELITL